MGPQAMVGSLRIGLLGALAWRLDVVVRVLGASAVVLLNWSLWTAVFDGRALVAGLTQGQLTTYAVAAWTATTFQATRIDRELGERVRSGDLALDLLRPWRLQLHLYLRDLGRASAALVLTTAPVAIWTAVALPLRMPTGIGTLGAVLVSLWLAHGVAFGLAWLTGLVAVRLRSADGVVHFKGVMIGLLSGSVIPLVVFPDAAQAVIMVLPFQAMAHAPAQLFIEQVAIGPTLLGQAAWAVALAVLGGLAWGWTRRRVVIQGG